MIISCPNCTSRFNLNAELLGEAGRKVKCAKCDHRWFAKPSDEIDAVSPAPAEAPAPPPPPAAPPPPAEKPRAKAPEPEPEADDGNDQEVEEVDEKAEEAAEPAEMPSPPPIPSEADIARFQGRPAAAKSTLIGWIGLFLAIFALVSGTVYFRHHIAAFYPPATRLFLAVGLTDTLGSGLKINDPKMSQRTDGDDRILVISGEIENETGAVIDVPLLRGAVKNTRGKELFVWSFKTKESRILAGEKNTYETEVRNPPPGATQLSITFTKESEMAAEKQRAKEAAAEPNAKK